MTQTAPEEPTVETIRDFARATRAIVRADQQPLQERLAALVRLTEEARRSEVPGLAQEAVWIECERFVRGEPEPEPPAISDPVEDAIRRQLRVGRIRCYACRRPLPDERELDRWRRLRLAAIEEYRLREEALR